MNSIAIIGCGAIAGYVATKLVSEPGCSLHAAIVRAGSEAKGADRLGSAVSLINSVDSLPAGTDLVLDCAGHSGLIEHGADVLRAGIDLVSVSVGALADDALHQNLLSAAKEGKSTLRMVSGAIGALDALSAASVGGLDYVNYTGTKPPAGWKGSAAEETLDLGALDRAAVHFEGSARDAALRYPKNANVAAAVALCGAGFENTRVSLIADPNANGNTHQVQAKGAFGEFAFSITGNALPDNPRSSALTAMSVVREVLNAQSGLIL